MKSEKKDYYDERLLSIDDEICALLKKRKEIGGKQSSMPPARFINIWAEQYDSHQHFLNIFFGLIRREEQLRLPIKPKGYSKHIPVLKSVEIEEVMYTITHILQYENVSVLHFNQDTYNANTVLDGQNPLMNFELMINQRYDCQIVHGTGTDGHRCYTFNITPPLPEDLSGLTFIFKEYSNHLKEAETGLNILFDLSHT
ncbi:hypothetical protein [Niallia sp. 03133]|uniref:hypothetical protein n=1 Tax=Niallia sp. 03133 TaxID=3458060 RepID=UPI004043B43D